MGLTLTLKQIEIIEANQLTSQEVLMISLYRKKTMREIADILNISLGEVSRRMRKAWQKLETQNNVI